MSDNGIFKKLKNTINKIDKKNAFVISCALIAIVFVSLFTPIYDISEISVEGNSVINSEVLIRASGILVGDSFFEADILGAKNRISKVAYVDNVKVRRVFPNKIRIIVTESRECAYISFVGSYIGIDSKGKILEVKQQLDQNSKPIVYGIKISNFTIGSYIDVDNEDKKAVFFDILNYIEDAAIENTIYSMDITNTDNIFFVLKNKITVKLGNTDNMKYKIAYLKTVLKEISGETGGTLDISDTENVTYTS